MNVSLDTNILVYAVEGDDQNSSKTAIAVDLATQDNITLSCQVLGEFYRAVTSLRRESPLSHADAANWIRMWSRHSIEPIRLQDVHSAVEITSRYRLHYFDALIIAVCKSAGCAVLYSEDLSHGQIYAGLKVENPFK